jgi:hypothetical protein
MRSLVLVLLAALACSEAPASDPPAAPWLLEPEAPPVDLEHESGLPPGDEVDV